VIPLVLGIAFLIFLINAVRFFIIGSNSTEGQENARNLALYGVGAFVLILSLWGIVNLLAGGFGLNEGPCINGDTVQSDYIDSNPPCSSPRPQPRPTGSFMPTGGPGTFPVSPNGSADPR
jgi:heme A synthase